MKILWLSGMKLISCVAWGVFAIHLLLGARCNAQELKTTTKIDSEELGWHSRIPVSMNGRLPTISSGWNKGYELKAWHSSIATSDRIIREWDPAPFFDEPLMIELCNAIFDADTSEMKRLIDAGADVNTVGKDGVTALFWALHMHRDPSPFEMLLQHGADPNVIVTKSPPGRNANVAALPGYAVTNLVVMGRYNRMFKNVFEHGGDPNLRNQLLSEIPAFFQLWPSAPDAVERLNLLIDKGADVSYQHPDTGGTFQMAHTGESEEGNQLALIVLKHGASYQLFYKRNAMNDEAPLKGCYMKLIHLLAEAEEAVNQRPPDQRIHFDSIVAWLEDRGESLAEAKADLTRWKQWKQQGRADLIEKEHKERLDKESIQRASSEREK